MLILAVFPVEQIFFVGRRRLSVRSFSPSVFVQPNESHVGSTIDSKYRGFSKEHQLNYRVLLYIQIDALFGCKWCSGFETPTRKIENLRH